MIAYCQKEQTVSHIYSQVRNQSMSKQNAKGCHNPPLFPRDRNIQMAHLDLHPLGDVCMCNIKGIQGISEICSGNEKFVSIRYYGQDM